MKFAKLSLIVVLLATAALASTPASDLWIAAVANTPGAFGTQWSSNGRFFNPSAAPVDVTMTFYAMVALGGASHTETYTIPGMTTVEIPNILDNIFGLSNTAGALHLTAPSNILAESRTFTPGSTGTFGQSIPGIPTSQAMVTGDSADLLYIDNSADYRTNVGLVDVSGAGSVATLQAYAPDGTAAGAPYTATLAANEPLQINGVLGVLGVGSGANYRIAVTIVSGKVIPYVSQVDNASGDPIYINGTVVKAGGGPAGCMTSGAYYGYSTFTSNPDYDWLDSPFAPTLVNGTLEGFAILATNHLGVNYVWPILWTDVYFDPPLDLVLEPDVPFSVDFTITFTYVGMPDNCVTATYTVGGTWDGCSKINAGTVDLLFKVSSDPGCKDLKDGQGKFDFAWEAGIDPAMAPVSAVKPMPVKMSAKHRIR